MIRTFIDAEVVFENSHTNIQSLNVEAINNFHAKKITSKDLLFENHCDSVKVIEVVDHKLFTLEKKLHLYQGNIFQGDTSQDILKIVVLNRYKEALPAISFIKGFHLKNGAIASSIAHDSHK